MRLSLTCAMLLSFTSARRWPRSHRMCVISKLTSKPHEAATIPRGQAQTRKRGLCPSGTNWQPRKVRENHRRRDTHRDGAKAPSSRLGNLRSILRQAGLSEEEFNEL